MLLYTDGGPSEPRVMEPQEREAGVPAGTELVGEMLVRGKKAKRLVVLIIGAKKQCKRLTQNYMLIDMYSIQYGAHQKICVLPF